MRLKPELWDDMNFKEQIRNLLNQNSPAIEKSIRLCLYCMKTQIFIDGNKRVSIILANHYMIRNGEGLLVVPEEKVEEFKVLLVDYYEGKDEQQIIDFMKTECWRQF